MTTFRFPCGGKRVNAVSTPRFGERPFSDSLHRCISELVAAVNDLAPFSAGMATRPGGISVQASVDESTAYGELPEEALLCGPADVLGRPLVVAGLALWNPAPVGSQDFYVCNGGNLPPDDGPYNLRLSLPENQGAESIEAALATTNEDFLDAKVELNNSPPWTSQIRQFVAFGAISIRADRHQVVEELE